MQKSGEGGHASWREDQRMAGPTGTGGRGTPVQAGAVQPAAHRVGRACGAVGRRPRVASPPPILPPSCPLSLPHDCCAHATAHSYTGRGASSGGGSGLPLLVTAAVDEIALTHPLLLARDVVVRGQVVWTGRSALDIRMQLFQVGSRAGGGAWAVGVGAGAVEVVVWGVWRWLCRDPGHETSPQRRWQGSSGACEPGHGRKGVAAAARSCQLLTTH